VELCCGCVDSIDTCPGNLYASLKEVGDALVAYFKIVHSGCREEVTAQLVAQPAHAHGHVGDERVVRHQLSKLCVDFLEACHCSTQLHRGGGLG
jgi:hypothetical protein